MEQKKQRRKIGFALLVSVVLHLLVGYSLAAFGNVFTPPLPEEETPPELTLMDLSPAPEKPKNPQFIETDKSKETAEKPKDQTFESNANSIAASEKPATGNLPLPSQDGVDRPTRDLETHDFSLQSEGSQAQVQQPKSTPATPAPKSKPSEPPKLSPSPAPSSTPDPEQLAMLTNTPPPAVKTPEEIEPSPSPEIAPSLAPVTPPPKPPAPSSSYQSQKTQTRS